jgi:predicted HicB family RNase H-like nuclease
VKSDRLQMRIDAKLKVRAEALAGRRHLSLTALVMELLAREVQADHDSRRAVNQEAVEQV